MKEELFDMIGSVIPDVPEFADETEAPDYSRKECWLSFPEITKDVDTFYIYSTTYVELSGEKGAPDYSPLDNPEMIMGAQGEYVTNARIKPSEMTGYFGPDSFHEDEYNIYYNNIKDNAAKRIAAYQAQRHE